ncbi:MAG: serine--tRNA ligase [Bacteroidota bacterium]|jgi:seryl-tRNA synthetase
MLQIKEIVKNPNYFIEALNKRGIPAQELIQKLLTLDEQRRLLIVEVETLKSDANTLSKNIGKLIQSGNTEEANQAKAQVQQNKGKIQDLETQLDELLNQFNDLLYQIPNAPHSTVPNGKSEHDNEVVATHGNIPVLPQNALPHWDLLKKFDLIDFELGVKITGAGFPVYKGKGAKLQRALINFFLDEATQAGYNEVIPPLVVNEDSGRGTGQLPDKEGQMYHVVKDELYLIPTAEVPITNIYRDVIVNEKDFPIKNVGYTPCFRREAGSYGKDVRGLNRLHQFDKVEIVQIAHPNHSYQILDEMVAYVASLLQKLELPYRILRLCAGDLGFTSALTYDFEVYSNAQQRWLEVSSVSNFETFQSNRLKLRYKDEEGKTQLTHTLNGSALALPRIVAALLENNQQEDGSIKIPTILQSYTKFTQIE